MKYFKSKKTMLSVCMIGACISGLLNMPEENRYSELIMMIRHIVFLFISLFVIYMPLLSLTLQMKKKS